MMITLLSLINSKTIQINVPADKNTGDDNSAKPDLQQDYSDKHSGREKRQ